LAALVRKHVKIHLVPSWFAILPVVARIGTRHSSREKCSSVSPAIAKFRQVGVRVCGRGGSGGRGLTGLNEVWFGRYERWTK